jgi:hypothetical protein
MNDLPKQKLREIIARYGKDIGNDPKRCEAILRDLCGQYRRELSVLVAAQKEQVPTELLTSHNSVPFNVTAARLVKRLQDNLGLAEDAARWAVNAWGFALGLIPDTATTVLQPSGNYSSPPETIQDYRQDNVYSPQHADPDSQPIVSQGMNSIQGNDYSAELNKANQQIKTAWIAGTVSGTLTLIMTLVSMNFYVLVDVFLIGGLTFGIYKKSRVCAVILLAYFVYAKILDFSSTSNINGFTVSIAVSFIYCFAQGVRGTFAYHRLTKSQP